ALIGLDVVVLEHLDVIGGTSARSSGTVWVPDSDLMRAAGFPPDRAPAEAYLGALVGGRGEAAMWQAFLDAAPAMLREIENATGPGFRPFVSAPDYRQELPGAAPGGRPLEPLPFDGRMLGAMFEQLAPPLPELTILGGMMVSRADASVLLWADSPSPAAGRPLSLA